MTRTRRDVRSVVAVLATVLVLSAVAFGTQRLVPPAFGDPTRMQTGRAALATSLPAIEHRDLGDSTDAKRWNVVGLLVAAAALVTGLVWHQVEHRGRRIARPGVPALSGRGPPSS